MTTHITQNPHSSTSNADADFPRSRAMESSDEIDLRELLSVIWQGKWLIVSITAVFAIGSVIFALMQPNIYKSDALLAPAESELGGSGLAALAGQFGGLASMAGINLGSGSGDNANLAIQVLKSRQFIGDFIKKHQILPELMAIERWNMADNSITFDPELYNSDTKTWVREVKAPFKPEPSIQEAVQEFNKILSVSRAKETGMITVTIQHQSPYIAKQWVDWMVRDINSVMKERDVQEAIRSTEFLHKQIELTNVADIKAILYTLVEEQAKTIMFAEVRDEYVFKTVDPAVVAEKKAAPQRLLLIALTSILGLIISIIILLVFTFFRKTR